MHLIKLLVCLTRFLPGLGSLHFVSRPLFTPRLFFHPWALLPTCFLSHPSYISSSDQAIVLGLRIFTCWQLRPREQLIMRIIAAKISISTTLYNLWCYIHQRRHPTVYSTCGCPILRRCCEHLFGQGYYGDGLLESQN